MEDSQKILELQNNACPFENGKYSYIKRDGKTYIRFRKTYEGYGRLELSGTDFAEINKRISDFEKDLRSSTTTDYQKLKKLKKLPLAEYIERYLEVLADERRDPTILTNPYYRISLAHIQNHSIGKLAVSRITEKEIKQYITDLAKAPYSYAKSTIDKDYALIKRSLAQAKREKVILENPVEHVAPIREDELEKQPKKVTSFDVDDIKKILQEAKRVNTEDCTINGDIGTRVYGVNADVICFLLYTGLRVGECLALRYSDIEVNEAGETVVHIRSSLKMLPDEKGQLTLQRGTTKTKTSVRSFVLYGEALKIIEAQKALRTSVSEDDYIFVGKTGKPIAYRNVNRTLRDILRRAKCKKKDASVHALRHTFGSVLVSGQVSLYTVSQLMGHSSIKITERVYAELLPHEYEDVTKCFDKLTEK